MTTTSKELLTDSSITATGLASLGNGSCYALAAVDNSSNLFFDAIVQLTLKTGGSSTSSTGSCAVYAIGSADGGTTWPEGYAGTAGSLTLTSPTNLKQIGIINMVANSTSYISDPMSVAAAFGGILPKKWAIAILNNTGGTLDSTGSNFAAIYEGLQVQSA